MCLLSTFSNLFINPFALCTPLDGWLNQSTFEQQYLENGEKMMFKACGIIGISKTEFLNFSGTERAKQNQNKLKTNQNLLSL